MLETGSSGTRNPNSILIALKPRQVLLAEHSREKAMAKSKKASATAKPDQKALLIHSILRYLDGNGFSKTLKRFLSEAQIENDNWRTSSLDLDVMCCKYLEICAPADVNFNTTKEKADQSGGVDEPARISKDMLTKDEDIEMKEKPKKKKMSKEKSDSFSQTDEVISEASKKTAGDMVNELQVDESSKKHKGKTKKKTKSEQQLDSLPGVTEDKSKDLASSKGDSEINADTKAKSKDKKKKNKVSLSEAKKEDPSSEGLDGGELVNQENPVSKKECSETSEGVTHKEKKGSKKRKREASNENEDQPVEEVAIEDSKRQKTELLGKAKSTEQISGVNIENKGANGEVGHSESEKTIKQFDVLANGEKTDEEKSAQQKSKRRALNGSSEPKTVNAFQRVKVEEVNFADERLQDNSYWAKDGADIGYGAKAQEVLGQVRGRDFRHEKTKKKRGSYRGGLIDLQSHSIKFNYADED